MTGSLELSGPAAGLIDEPLALRVRGAGPGARLVWRARLRDDDGRVWKATAPTAAALDQAWAAAKASAGARAALESLRPARVDVRVETPDGLTASRTVTRRLVGDGVRVRRWRGDLVASLFLPADEAAGALLVDATGADDPAPAMLAAALLASRGVLVLVVPPPRSADEGLVGTAAERLAAVPGARAPRIVPAADVPLPPGVPAAEPGDPAAWDALLAECAARPRQAVAGAGSA